MGQPWGSVLRGVLALLWVIIAPLLAWSAPFQECISIYVHSNVPFHVSLILFPISPLLSPCVCHIPHDLCPFLNMLELVHQGVSCQAEVLAVSGLLTPVSFCTLPSGTRTGNFLACSTQIIPIALCLLKHYH